MDTINTASRTALGPTHPPNQWVPGTLSLGAKRPGREAANSPPSSAEFKEWVELYIHPPIRRHAVVLSYSTGINLTFYLNGHKADPAALSIHRHISVRADFVEFSSVLLKIMNPKGNCLLK